MESQSNIKLATHDDYGCIIDDKKKGIPYWMKPPNGASGTSVRAGITATVATVDTPVGRRSTS